MNRNRRIVISTALASTAVIGASAVAVAASAVSAITTSTHLHQTNAPAPNHSSVEAAALALKLQALDAQAHGLNETLTTVRAKVAADRLALLNSRLAALNVPAVWPSTAGATIKVSYGVSQANPAPSTSGEPAQSEPSTKPLAPPTHVTTGASGSTTTHGDDGDSHDVGSGSDPSSPDPSGSND